MKNKFEKTGRVEPKSDQQIANDEMHEEISDTIHSPELKFRKYEYLQEDLDTLISSYFSSEHKEFMVRSKPDVWKIFSSFSESANFFRDDGEMMSPEKIESLADERMDALLSAATIRYIDDFIDTSLWPHIADYNSDVLLRDFELFLEEAHRYICGISPDIPKDLISLPILEMSLETNPTQENFDAQCKNLVKYKSFDLLCIDKIIKGEALEDLQKEMTNVWYEIASASDLSRDFDPYNYQYEKDYNLKNFLERTDLDPTKLIEYLEKLERSVDIDDDEWEMLSENQKRSLNGCRKLIDSLIRYIDKV